MMDIVSKGTAQAPDEGFPLHLLGRHSEGSQGLSWDAEVITHIQFLALFPQEWPSRLSAESLVYVYGLCSSEFYTVLLGLPFHFMSECGKYLEKEIFVFQAGPAPQAERCLPAASRSQLMSVYWMEAP